MEHNLMMAGPFVFGAGAWLRWAAVPALLAYRIGRRVERLRRSRV